MGIFTKKPSDGTAPKTWADRWYNAWAFMPWLISKAIKGMKDGWRAGKL